MNPRITVMLVDSSVDYLELVTEAINRQPDMQVCAKARDGATALEIAMIEKPDVLVMESKLRKLDGIELIWRLKIEERLPPTIVVLSVPLGETGDEYRRYGIETFLEKPYEPSTLIETIHEVLKDGGTVKTSANFEGAITAALINVGFDTRHQGYTFFREAISRVISDRSLLDGVTKRLYPDIAKKYSSSSASVERSMRNALENAWKKTSEASRGGYFHHLSFQTKKRPSNSKFLVMMSDFVVLKVKLEEEEHNRLMGAIR